MPRAGFAVNSLINLALADTEDIADTIEQELLTPGLADVYAIIQQYVPQSQILRIPGRAREAIQVFSKADIHGDYSFTWQGALGFQDTQQRAHKFMQLLQVLLNHTPLQLLQQGGQTLDLAVLLRSILASGLGERGLSDILIAIPAAQIQQQQAQQSAIQSTQQQQVTHQQTLDAHSAAQQQIRTRILAQQQQADAASAQAKARSQQVQDRIALLKAMQAGQHGGPQGQ